VKRLVQKLRDPRRPEAAGIIVTHREKRHKSTTAVVRWCVIRRAASIARRDRDAELSATRTKLSELQKTMDAASAQRDKNAWQAAALEAKVNELTQLA
jgi:hypothetical protein